ncbi:succinate dehydrogenase [Litoreibacter halocynthiae]|uniref:succinate dehydrogenase n=1 Tax=Litoreibacter halocynthiae TaxID=1242689 RepID=UPI0024912B94|nr:succinate dehydrogenase [Litoreibacter halocynthiae]
MKLVLIPALAALFTLSACGDDGLADQLARKEAKDTVRPVLAKRFPGVPLEPATDCVIDNASAGEILKLARAGVTGLGPEETQLVIEIATRPDTIECLLKDGLSPFLMKKA